MGQDRREGAGSGCVLEDGPGGQQASSLSQELEERRGGGGEGGRALTV